MSLEKDNSSVLSVHAKDREDAIHVMLKNTDILKRPFSLQYPEQTKYWKTELKSISNSLIVSFDFMDTSEDTINLVVHMRYGKPPTDDLYDVRMDIKFDKSNQNSLIYDLEGAHSLDGLGNATSTVSCKIIDDKSFTCLKTKYNIDTMVWFSAKYYGPMPPKKLVTNKYSYSVEEYGGYWNFTSAVHEPSCMFWNNIKQQFDAAGLEVPCYHKSEQLLHQRE